MSRVIRVDTHPPANGYARRDERIVEISSDSGGFLLSLHQVDGRLRAEIYRADPTVDVVGQTAP